MMKVLASIGRWLGKLFSAEPQDDQARWGRFVREIGPRELKSLTANDRAFVLSMRERVEAGSAIEEGEGKRLDDIGEEMQLDRWAP